MHIYIYIYILWEEDLKYLKFYAGRPTIFSQVQRSLHLAEDCRSAGMKL